MIIELRGVDFVNKGAELMMLAIIAKVKEEFPESIFVMEKNRRTPRFKYLQYGIYLKTNFTQFRIQFKYLFALVPSFIRKLWHYIDEKEVDVVLDASGFAYSDIWGVKRASRLGDHIEKWKKEGKKVILLPQAFGPFSGNDIIEVMRTVIKHSDYVFARDLISLNYLTQLNGDTDRINLAPDFTNLIQGTVPSYFDSSTCEIAIIVNSKMIETTSGKDGEAYIDLLTRIINKINDFGHKPYFLIHEGKMDIKVAERINETLPNRLPVIEEEDPLHVKGIISKSKAVVTSRFHGLVSCLSQGIPCLATGWSHKYEMLLKDYNYAEALLDVYCNDELLSQKVKFILSENSRSPIVENLKTMGLQQKQLSTQMWAKVFNKMKE
jgi:polysaccharide pyruvyl transferase WcaK-like protein